MKLEDIYYFSIKKLQHPQLFDFAQHIVEISESNSQDEAEIQRRIMLLSRAKDAEHVRQCSNFLAEVGAFDDLLAKGKEPHWVPESKIRMPDLDFSQDDHKHPVEVKHLNSPREEHDALFSGKAYGGNVDNNYQRGLEKKISDFIDDARSKFASYNRTVNGINSSEGTLYLFFSKSIDAGLLDGIEWVQSMKQRVSNIASPLAGKDIELIITDIDLLVPQK